MNDFINKNLKGVAITMTNNSTKPSISMITNDRLKIQKYLEERVDAVNTVKNLIDKWRIKPDEIFDVMMGDESFIIDDEDAYRNEYSEDALRYSRKVHDLFEIDYKCKKCLKRAVCCKFDNLDNDISREKCFGINHLLDAPIIIRIEDYYIQKKIGTDA